MKGIIVLMMICIHFQIFGQNIKTIEPIIGEELDFSHEFIQNFNSPDALKRCDELEQRIKKEGRNYSELTPKEKLILKYCDLSRDNAWDIIGGGCSWYCGGGPSSVTASSQLKATSTTSYSASNAQDLSYQTAWVEGVDGDGIGEFLVYHFAPQCPRITNIIVVNGYVKSKSLWQNNSRVKRLKMYVNEKPYAILELKDIMAEQRFVVEPIGNADRKDIKKLESLPAWTIKFEIMDVYKGLKYQDTAITEIYFDGIDVH